MPLLLFKLNWGTVNHLNRTRHERPCSSRPTFAPRQMSRMRPGRASSWTPSLPITVRIAAYYIENESGAKLARPELFRLLSDARPGDVLLVEQVDRLSRLTASDWE